ncbi:MAG: Asp-tRNA(Asn)/Glu-tRNA(Gln) amidotransferase subunit GatA [bacterium]
MSLPASITRSIPTVSDIARWVASGTRSAEETVREALDRIRSDQPHLNTFLHVNGESALREADRIDALDAAGRERLPLAGVPLAAKDMFVTPGREGPTTAGSRLLERWRAPEGYESAVLRRLRDAGAVLVGKTNQDEFGMGSSGEHSAFGPTRNPLATDRVPGGSSSGSAAAVASGSVPVALGTDTGGSVRQPASLTGTVGLRPTWGRVSRYGMVAFASSFDQAGPITRTVEDAALLLESMAGPDRRDATCGRQQVDRWREAAGAGVEGLRVGVAADWVGAIPGTAAEALEEAVGRLEEAGARLREVTAPPVEDALAAYYLIAASEAGSNLARYDGVRYGYRAEGCRDLDELYGRSRGEGLGREVRRRVLLGAFALTEGYADAHYQRARRVQAGVREAFARLFQEVDVLIGPTSPQGAWPLGAKEGDPLAMYRSDSFTVPASLGGIPALSLPCGCDDEGLPMGAQVMADRFREDLLFRAAGALEEGPS